MKFDANKLLTNKYVLYAILILAILDLLGYLQYNNFNAIIFFLLVAGLTYCFTKNMTIVFLASIFMTKLWTISNVTYENMAGAIALQRDAVVLQKNRRNDISGVQLQAQKEKMFENMSTMRKEISNPKMVKEKKDNKRDDSDSGGNIDYQKTLENSYENLQKMLGSDGIQNLSKDTMKLMEKQEKLAESMKTLEPMLNDAKNMLGNMNFSNIESLSKMLSGFTKKQ
jgi:hypothetical protein